MAFYTAPTQNTVEDKNVFYDEQFSIAFTTLSNTQLEKDYKDLFALGQYAWVTSNAWVYNFCKDVCLQLTRGKSLTEKQRECLVKNLARVFEPPRSRR